MCGDQLHRIGIVAEPLAHLATVFTEQDAMADRALERRLVEQRRREHEHRVEPAARLRDVLRDEVAREARAERGLVLEWSVKRREWHRARLEPAIEYVGDAP